MLLVQGISELARQKLAEFHVDSQKLRDFFVVNVSDEIKAEARANGKFSMQGQEFALYRHVLMLPGEVVAARKLQMVSYLETVFAELENFKRNGWMHPAKTEMLQDGLKAITRRIEEE